MQFWQAYHIQSVGGADIYYGAVIFPSGRVYEGRYGGWLANNGGAYSCCVRGFGVCLAGSFNSEFPSLAALETLVRLGVEAREVLHQERYWGHRDCAAYDSRNRGNDCPGQRLYDWLPVLRRAVETGEGKEEDEKVNDFIRQELNEKGQGIFAGMDVAVFNAFGLGSDSCHLRVNIGEKRPLMGFATDIVSGAIFKSAPDLKSDGFVGTVRPITDAFPGTVKTARYWIALHMPVDDAMKFRGFIQK